MRKSTELEKFSVLIGKLDLLISDKKMFCKEATDMRLRILRSDRLAFNQKSTLIADISYKADQHGYTL
jgi:hypothetical protein